MSDPNPLVDPSSQFNPDDYAVSWDKVKQGDYSTLNPISSGPGGDWLSGTGLWDDCATLGKDIAANKAGAADYIAVGLDTLGVLIDPIGTAAGMLAGWMMDHLKPLKMMLDELAGNPDTVTGVANTWNNISKAMTSGATSYANAVSGQTADWHGDAADAYRTQANKLVQAMGGAGALADAMSQISTIGGEIVATVRSTVRDIISLLIGFLVDLAIEEACSLGAATPVVIAQGIADIGKATKETVEAIDKACTVIGLVIAVAGKVNTLYAEIVKVLPNLEQTGRDVGPAIPAVAG